MPAVVAPAVGLRYTGTMAAAASVRDIRLDLFRELALWFIFLDHIPTNIVSWLTVRNYGFSDATEIFVFISGYTAVIAYSRMMEREGWIRAAARIYRRVWQLYVAHILLFVAFSAQIAFVSISRFRAAAASSDALRAASALACSRAIRCSRVQSRCRRSRPLAVTCGTVAQ